MVHKMSVDGAKMSVYFHNTSEFHLLWIGKVLVFYFGKMMAAHVGLPLVH